jgi:hypothetical protein
MSSTTQQLKDKLPKGDRERLAGLLKTAKAELLHLQQTDIFASLAQGDGGGRWCCF